MHLTTLGQNPALILTLRHMLITIWWKVPQRSEACQIDHKSRGYLKLSLQCLLYKRRIKTMFHSTKSLKGLWKLFQFCNYPGVNFFLFLWGLQDGFLLFTVGLKPWIEQNPGKLSLAVCFSFQVPNSPHLLLFLVITFLWSGVHNVKDRSLVLANIPDMMIWSTAVFLGSNFTCFLVSL